MSTIYTMASQTSEALVIFVLLGLFCIYKILQHIFNRFNYVINYIGYKYNVKRLIMMNKPQLFILEGPDCVGKTTTMDLLEKACLAKGKGVIKVSVLDTTPFCADVRTIVTQSNAAITEETKTKLLVEAHLDAIMHIATECIRIDEANLKDYVFILDRFLLSTFAYQGQYIDHDIIQKLFLRSGVLDKLSHFNPVFLLLKCDDVILDKRLSDKNNKDLIELKDQTFHTTVRNYYRFIAPTKLSTVFNYRYANIETGNGLDVTSQQLTNLLNTIFES